MKNLVELIAKLEAAQRTEKGYPSDIQSIHDDLQYLHCGGNSYVEYWETGCRHCGSVFHKQCNPHMVGLQYIIDELKNSLPHHACGCVPTRKWDGEGDPADFIIEIETSFCPECQRQIDAQEEQELEKLLDAYEKSLREADERRGAFCNACNYDAESPQWNCEKCIQTQESYKPLIPIIEVVKDDDDGLPF